MLSEAIPGSFVASTEASTKASRVAAPGGWIEASAAPPAASALGAGLDRGARQPELIDGPADMAARLGACRVAVIGAGSIGQRVIDSLARLGIGGLCICDPRNTKPESLLTHPISADEIGVSKALLGARRARAISPQMEVQYFRGAFESLPMDALVGISHVLIATDNLAAEISITQACIRLALPQFQAAVYGPALIAQVRSLPGDEQGAGPCVACGYLKRDWDDLDAGTRFSCEGHADAVPAPTTRATMSFPHLCGIAAELMVGEWFRSLLAPKVSGEAGVGSVLEYCGFHGGSQRTSLHRKLDCPIEHESWSIRSGEPSVAALTPRDLGHIARYDDLREVSIRVEGFSFASHTACGCAVHPALGRFHAEGMPPTGPCPICHDQRMPHPLHTYREVPGGALSGHLDRRLAELGVRGEPSVLVRGPCGSTLIPSSAKPSIARIAPSAIPALAIGSESDQERQPQ